MGSVYNKIYKINPVVGVKRVYFENHCDHITYTRDAVYMLKRVLQINS